MRLLPYYQEARRSGQHIGRKDCTTCRGTLDVTTRQTIGCVYEEPTTAPARLDALRWPNGVPSLPWRDVDGKPVAPRACPFYLGRLAERSDVTAAYPHFLRGTLAAWLGRAPDATLLELLESFDDGVNDWRHDPSPSKPKPKERA